MLRTLDSLPDDMRTATSSQTNPPSGTRAGPARGLARDDDYSSAVEDDEEDGFETECGRQSDILNARLQHEVVFLPGVGTASPPRQTDR